jgi:uncharacterized protein
MFRLSIMFMFAPLGLSMMLHWWSLRHFLSDWRLLRWARRISIGLFSVIFACLFAYLVVRAFAGRPAAVGFLSVSWIGTLLALPTGIALPVGAALRKLLSKIAKLKSAKQTPLTGGTPAISRRALLVEGSAALAPAVAASMSTAGINSGQQPTRLKHLSFEIEHLPRELDGLKILHLSDLHLGATKSCADLTAVLQAAMAAAPDLVLVTGDIADDDEELSAAMHILGEFQAPLGVYASLGNHEYLNGIRKQRRIIEQSKVPLLVNRGVHRDHNGASVYIAGIDDPLIFDGSMRPLMQPWIDQAAAGANNAPLRILMSHRPQAVDHAAEKGFHLVLSGHTHGGQLGMFGRSVLEWIWPSGLWWGSYTVRGSTGQLTQLYTTSGFGDWFPFRLGCPTEAPLITLRSGA